MKRRSQIGMHGPWNIGIGIGEVTEPKSRSREMAAKVPCSRAFRIHQLKGFSSFTLQAASI